MKTKHLIPLFLLAACAAGAAEPEPGPFRLVRTPSGCAVVFDKVEDEYRVDRLVDGGITLSFFKTVIPAQEGKLKDDCIESFRSSPQSDGRGSTIELRPTGHEFSALLRNGTSLTVAFEKVYALEGGTKAANVDASYRIGVGDQLQITVYGHEDLTKKALVGDDGTVDFPLLGSIPAAGRSLKEFQDDLRTKLGKDYIVNPQVAVEVATYKSQFAFVTGLVRTPQKVPLEGATTLKDALSAAGGYLPEAGYSISVARQVLGPDGTPREPQKMAFSRADIESGLANLQLKPGDVITVSEKDYFYIQGEVHKPGKYELRPGTTFLQAIAQAEGLTDWANKKDIALNSKVGKKDVRQVLNMKNIERQKSPDVQLAAGDIIIVYRRIL